MIDEGQEILGVMLEMARPQIEREIGLWFTNGKDARDLAIVIEVRGDGRGKISGHSRTMLANMAHEVAPSHPSIMLDLTPSGGPEGAIPAIVIGDGLAPFNLVWVTPTRAPDQAEMH